MKKLFATAFTLSIIFLSQDINAQGTKISFSEITITVNEVSAKGENISFAFMEGKTSIPYRLYKSDTLTITAEYRLNAYNSKRSQIKDSSLRLHIFYECIYKGETKSTKVERMYFLNDKFEFSEKETFNIKTSKYANTQVKLSYKGTIAQ